jgi:hypothetical protein
MEGRLMLGMFGEVPTDARVHEEMVSALQEMCLAAAKTVYDERYVGPTEEQLDEIAEAAAARMSTTRTSLWPMDDEEWRSLLGTGNTSMTPIKVAKVHQKHIKRNTEGREKLEQKMEELEKQMALMREELHEVHKRTLWWSAQEHLIQEDLKHICKTQLSTNKRLEDLERLVMPLLNTRLAIRGKGKLV